MRFFKVGAVVVFAVVLTTLGISASDVLQGKSGSLLGQLAATDPGVCPSDMVELPAALSFTCVDRFEVSSGSMCPIRTPASAQDTQTNLNDTSCIPTAQKDTLPWSNVTREQAVALCARVGKRLPTAAEWYTMALGTPDTAACNTSGGSVRMSGSNEACVSSGGAFDAVGNVWEWVADDVRDAKMGEFTIPSEGYVTQVDSGGIPTMTNPVTGDVLFGDDYFWSEPSGVFGVLRGGYYGSKSDAGLFSVQAKTPPTSATVAIGFRCVR